LKIISELNIINGNNRHLETKIGTTYEQEKDAMAYWVYAIS